MKKILIACFYFAISTTIAQKNLKFSDGYIVKSGDTIRGFIKSDVQKRIQLICSFRTSLNNEIREFSPNEIQGFFIKGLGFFQSKKKLIVEGEAPLTYFLQVLESGKASLFLLIDSKNRYHYFIEKDSTINELIQKETFDRTENGLRIKRTDYLFRAVLIKAFQDCPQNVTKLGLFASNLAKIVNEYNRCKDPNHGSKTNISKKDRRFYLGYSFGLTNNTLDMINIVNVFTVDNVAGFGRVYGNIKDYSDSYSFSSNTHGINFELGLGNNAHFALAGGLLLSQKNLLNSKLLLDFLNLDLPLQLKYSGVLQAKVRPFISLGILLPFTINNSTYSKGIQAYDLDDKPLYANGSPVLIEPLERNRFILSQLNLIGSLGIDFVVSERSKFSVQYRYQKADLSNSARIDINLNSGSIISSFVYRLKK